MNAKHISFEYLLKARRLTWENAELIDHLFGPVAAEEKSDEGKEIDQDSCKNVNEENHDILETKQGRRHDVYEASNGVYVHVDYNKVINVRVLLSNIHHNGYINKYSSSSEFCKEPPAPSDNTPSVTDALMTVSSPQERSKEDNQNKCSTCHKKFKYKSHLTRHLRTHTGEKPFSCPQCEKKFAEKGHLKSHLLIHSSVKEFSCDICNKLFARKGQLTVHSRSHTGEKPHGCTECNAMFSTKSNLNVHMRTHTGETPYQCEICEKRFTQHVSLKTHLLIHSEEKPFACTYANCTKIYRRKDHLQSHTRTHAW